jgi:tetratricopeptide (TPR) repeat protein
LAKRRVSVAKARKTAAQKRKLALEAKRKSLDKVIAEARKALAADQVPRAVYLYRRALGIAGSDKTMRAKVAALGREIEPRGQAMLAEADKKYAAGDYLAALTAYQRVAVVFRPSGLASGKKAAAKLAEAEKDPKVAAALKEVKAAALFERVDRRIQAARTKMLESMAALAASAGADPDKTPDDAPLTAVVSGMSLEHQAEVVDTLTTVVKLYGDTPTGEKAAPMLEKLKSDKKMMASIEAWKADEAVRQLLGRGKMYEAAAMYKKAAGHYQQLLTKHPKSEYAAEAREGLAKIKAKQTKALSPH